MSNDPIEKIRRNYENPIIEKKKCPFPNIELYSVFEEEDYADDPLLTDKWFIYSEGQISEDIPWDFLILKPNSIEIAIDISKWLIYTYNWDHVVKFDNINVNDENFPPIHIIEIITKVSSMYIGLGGDWDIKKYIIKVHSDQWSFQEKIQ